MHVAHDRHEKLRTRLGYSSRLIFSVAHREFCLTNQTAQQSGFHSDDMIVDDSSISRVVEILQCFAKPAVLLDYSLEVR
jgi:hypothetical protein